MIPHDLSFSCAVALSSRSETPCALGVEPRRSVTTPASPRRPTRPFAPDVPSSRCKPSVLRRRSAARWPPPKPQISIAQRRRPADSFLDDFRTPAGIRNPSRRTNGGLGECREGRSPSVPLNVGLVPNPEAVVRRLVAYGAQLQPALFKAIHRGWLTSDGNKALSPSRKRRPTGEGCWP